MRKEVASSIQIRAIDVYNVYPHVDLLPIDRPFEGWTIHEWLVKRWRQLVECGDTLFLFILRELADAGGEIYEGRNMMQRAIFDLEAVRDAIGDLQ